MGRALQASRAMKMSVYSLESGDLIYRLTCECCATEKNRVWGFVSKADEAHAVYYALLNVSEEVPRVGLTLSVGPWGEGTDPVRRSWVHVNVKAEADKLLLEIRDPKESNFFPWPKGGNPLTPEQAAGSNELEEFRSVADFILRADLAIDSYLSGAGVNAQGREIRDADASRSCS